MNSDGHMRGLDFTDFVFASNNRVFGFGSDVAGTYTYIGILIPLLSHKFQGLAICKGDNVGLRSGCFYIVVFSVPPQLQVPTFESTIL